ncbi:hypothetical protein RRF57_007530 [Xylaria bambusicola]|uniref:N-acetyltransferase domain-containing protein n=1 Tax=Xylaria bambusicola TaxID=326684 RepID=A0AAN7US53_9PEZI
MPLLLKEVDPEVDFPSLARCVLEAYEEPLQSFIYLFFAPMHGSNARSREVAIDEAAERLKLWHTSDPTSFWQKVVDTDTGRIVGGAAWNIYMSNPFVEPHAVEVSWYPDDGSRAYVEKALESYARPRYMAAQRAHVYLFNVFAHPDYRRKGIGQQVMDWGMKKADDLGLELFLDATPLGKPLYKKNGLVCIEENVTGLERKHAGEGDNDKWNEMVVAIGSFSFCLMTLPIGGKCRDT